MAGGGVYVNDIELSNNIPVDKNLKDIIRGINKI